MGFFNRLRGGNEAPAANNNGWDSVAETAEIDEHKIAQKRKVVSALLPGNGNPDISAIAREPSSTPADEDALLRKMASGEVGKTDYEKILSSIKGPMTDRAGIFDSVAAQHGLEKMYQDKHELKILAYANGFDVDGTYQQTGIRDVERAISNFKTPIEFEEKMEPFMTFLALNNSPAKAKEYEAAMDSLETTLFGKKYEYWKQIKELEAKSKDITFSERERTSETLIRGGSMYQISRFQARNNIRAKLGETLPEDETCEDASFVDTNRNVFGVFDGTGGHAGGRRASNIASETMGKMLAGGFDPKNPDNLAEMLDEASRQIAKDPAASYSTGTLAKLVKNESGKKALLYAQVGDSRLYVVSPDGRATLITKDEGAENKISNALGLDGKDHVCVQAGYRELNSGDKIVLCSDGITGDRGEDLMSEDELGSIVKNAGDVAYAAQALVHGARKNDDRTALVFEV